MSAHMQREGWGKKECQLIERGVGGWDERSASSLIRCVWAQRSVGSLTHVADGIIVSVSS